MKWDKQNKKRLHDLLEGADHDRLQDLGVKIIKAPLGEKGDRKHILIPIITLNKSQLIRHYLGKDPKSSTGNIVKKIKEELWLDVNPTLVHAVKHFSHVLSEVSFEEIDYLKIPKETAEKFLVLGIP